MLMVVRRLQGCVAAARYGTGAARLLTTHRSSIAMPPIPAVSVPEYLIGQSRKFGDHPALIDGPTGKMIRYSELEPMIKSVAAGLAARGLGQGDVIGILSPNCIEYPIALHGALLLGCKVTTLNSLYTPFEVARQLKDAGATQLIVAGPLLETAKLAITNEGANLTRMYTLDAAAAVADDSSAIAIEPFSVLLAGGAPPPAAIFDPATHVAVIPYSSGTSGMPKGVELTHRNVLANVLQAKAEHVQLSTEDTLVGVLPFFHIYGLTVILNIALASGSTVVTLPKFEPELFLRVLKQHHVTVAHVAPPLVGFLAKHPAVEKVLPLPRLRELFSGAAPLGSELEVEVRARLKCGVRQGYGMTETAPATHVVPVASMQANDASGSVGTLLPGMECKIVSTENGAVLGVDQRGELCLKGPNVMKGYLNRPDANAESFDADGFYRTGDVGYVDSKGMYYVVDRVKELIKVKGYQVPPAELEAVLLGCDAIADAAVIGVQCPKSGEQPKAYVVRQVGHESFSEVDVAAFLHDKVAEYKRIVPELVEFVKAVPKSAAGKILRKELRAMEEARSAAKAA